MNNDLQYYLKYIISWFYFNILNTDASYAVLRILIIIGLVSLLVYQEYILFTLLCIVVVCVEMLIRDNNTANTIRDIFSIDLGTASKYRREVAKDELTTGVSLSSREGFSLGLPKIITGDDSGKDYRRPNKFIEEHSREFTDKYFSSKQCSIGSGVGEITMFGSNEIIGNRREASFNRIYNFGMLTGGSGGTKATNAVVVFTYLKDCVYNPIKRNDFRGFKTTIFKDIN